MSFQKIRKKEERLYFILDAVMIILLVINLFWIVFDWLFSYPALQTLMEGVSPVFTQWYGTSIHPRFILIDLAFVSVFLTEFVVRWIMAVRHRVYHRWFFFPFIHFYDLLGCIPVGGFRFLRLLRIISITWRLQKNGIIDLGNTALFTFLSKYYRVLIEELSDRVTLNILGDLQDEVVHGGPVADRIVTDVLMPRKPDLVEWMSHRIGQVAAGNYERYSEDLRQYVEERINRAVENNRELARLDHIPLIGPALRTNIQDAVSDIVFHVINGMMQDLASERNRRLIDETTDILFDAILLPDDHERLSPLMTDTIWQSLEVIKEHVRVQQWKLRDLATDEEDFQRRLREALYKASEKKASGSKTTGTRTHSSSSGTQTSSQEEPSVGDSGRSAASRSSMQ